MTFESDDEHYAWANESLCIARRDRHGPARPDARSPAADRGQSRIRAHRKGLQIAITTETPLARHGLNPDGRVYWQPTTALLYSHALERGEGKLAEGGPLVVDTGRFTGRSPKDKFVVQEPSSEERDLVGSGQPAASTRSSFDGLRAKVVAHLEPRRPLRRRRVRRRRHRTSDRACA